MPKFKNTRVDVCKMCPNDPRNGGTGICYCALPAIANPTLC